MADIEIRIIGRDEYSAQITKLKSELTALGAEQSRISGTAFNAFSRAQIGPQIAALEEMRGAIRKSIAELEVMQSTVGRGVDLRSTINSLLGLDQTIKSASASARILGSSVAAAAAEDSRIRDATAAYRDRVRATQEAAVAASAEARARAEAMAASEAAGFGARPRRASASVSEPDPERLAAQALAVRAALAGVKDGATGVEQAKAKLAELETQFDSLAAAAQRNGQSLIGNASAELQAIKTAELHAAVNQKLVQDAGALYVSIKAGEAAHAESVASINAASAAYTRLHGTLRQAGIASHEAGNEFLSNARVIQHGSGIIDSALRGSRGQMLSSIGAMARDTGLLKAAIEGLASPWGAVAAAGVAALAALGYEAEQAYQRFRSLTDTANELALKGFGSGQGAVGPAIPTNISGEFDKIQSDTNEYAGSVRHLQEELNKLPVAAQASRSQFIELAQGLSGLKQIEPDKAIAPFVKAAESGVEPLAKLLTAELGLQGATTSTGESLEEVAKRTASADDAFAILLKTAIELRQNVLNAGKAGREASSNLLELSLGAAAAAGSVGEFGSVTVAFDDFGNALQKSLEPLKDVDDAANQASKAFRDQQAAIDLGNASLDKRIRLLQELAFAQQAITSGPSTQGEHGGPGGDRTRRAGEAARNLQVEVQSAPLPPAVEEENRIRLEGIRAQAEARRSDLSAQATAADARVRAARDEMAARITTGRQEAGLPTLSSSQIQTQVEATEKVKAAEDAALEAHRRVEDEKVEITKLGIRAQISETSRGDQARIDDQKKLIAIDEQQVASGRANARVLAEDKIQLGNLVRQAQLRAFQEARDIERGNIEAAHGQADAVEQIIAAYDRLYALQAKSPGVSPASQAQLRREEIRDLESEQSKRFQQINEANSGAAKLGSIQVQAAKMSLEAQVSAHQISKEQMASQEATLTDSILQQQMARVQNELKLDGLTEKQQQQLHQELADLYTKDAQAQEQAQKQITAAIEAENEKRIKIFTSFFDTAGSGFEKFITEGLTRSTTLIQAETQLAKSLIGSAVSGIGTLASNYAGKALGPHLGLTEEQSTGGLGSVLGNVVAKQLGLLKDVPQDKGAQAAQLMQKAADEQSKAIDKFSAAVEAFVKGNQEINKVKAQVGSGAGGGTVAGTLLSEGSGSDPRGMEPIIRASALKYGIDPNVAMKVARSEGLGTFSGDKGTSFGAFQLHTGGGEGDRFKQETGLDPSDPKNEPATIDFAMKRASQVGWSPWHGAANTGVGDWQGIGTASQNNTNNQLTDAQKQLLTSTQKVTETQMQQGGAIDQAVKAYNDNQSAVSSDSNALKTHTASTTETSTALGGSGTGGGASGLLGAARGAASSLSGVTPVASGVASVLGIAQSAITLFSSATSAATAATAGKSALSAIPIFGGLFDRGGIVPSAAGGMIVPPGAMAGGGQLSILHPREMVLPASISDRIQSNMGHLMPPERSSVSNANANMTYAPQISGRFGSISSGEMRSMLRTHGDMFESFARNVVRNNGLFR